MKAAEELLPVPRLHELFSYDSETGILTRKKARSGRYGKVGEPITGLNKYGYVRLVVRPYTLFAHRVAWAMHYGQWPTQQIDHINRVKTDNGIANLRQATPEQNSQNCGVRPQNKTGVTGVSWRKRTKKWIAYICVSRKRIDLGEYRCFEDAVFARRDAERKFHPFLSPVSFGTPSPDVSPALPGWASTYVVAKPRPIVSLDVAVKAASLRLQGISFARVAKACGISKTYVRKIMSGQNKPQAVEQAKRLAESCATTEA